MIHNIIVAFKHTLVVLCVAQHIFDISIGRINYSGRRSTEPRILIVI